MTKDQKNEVIELLKGKFTQYNNFYVTDTETLTVAQIGKLRKACFDKQVEMKVAKNTLIKKALESLDGEKYSGVYESLHKVTALMFSENPKDPALIISSFRKAMNGERPELKAAFINGDVYTGDNSLKALTQIKTKNELIGEVIGLLQSPAKRVIAALLNHHEKNASAASTPTEDTKPVEEVKANEGVTAETKHAESAEAAPVENVKEKEGITAETKHAESVEAKSTKPVKANEGVTGEAKHAESAEKNSDNSESKPLEESGPRAES